MEQPSPLPKTEPPPAAPIPPVQPKKIEPRFNPWRVFIGGFIILLGLTFLAQQFGWSWVDPGFVWKLWPVFIILIGLSLLWKGRVVSSIIGLVFVLAIMFFVLVAQTATRQAPTHFQDISIDQQSGATAARVAIDLGAAKMTIRGGSDQLLAGTYETNSEDLRVDNETTAGTQTVTLERRSDRTWWSWQALKSELNLRVANTLPIDLLIDSGAADLNLDLTNVQTRMIDINAGASSLDLTLDDLVASSQVTIDSGAASLTIRVPREAGVRVNLDAGVSGKNFPAGWGKIDDDLYETSGYATAANKIEFSIDAGASSITFEQY